MSTILKALRRLEDEKRSQQPASLEEDVLSAAELARRSPRAWVLSLGIATGASLAVVLLLGMIVYTLPISPLSQISPPSVVAPSPGSVSQSGSGGPSGSAAPSVASPPAPVAVRVSPVSRPAVAAAPQLRPLPLARIEPAPPVVASTELAPADSARRSQRPVPAAAPVSEPPPPSLAAVRPPPVALAPTSLRPVDAAVPLDVAPVEPAPAPVAVAVPRPDRVAREAAVEVLERRPMPTLRVTRTIWHPSPDRRVAVVQLLGRPPQRLGEGDVVAGFTVVQIGLAEVELERDGVILERRVGAK